MNRKKIIIIACVLLGILILFFVLSLIYRKNPTTGGPAPTPSPLPSPTPTPVPENMLLVTKTNPAINTSTTYLPITEIEFVFNKKVDPKTVLLNVLPLAETKIRQKPESPLSLFVAPATTWKPGITTITITSALSEDKTPLSLTFTYSINTSFPKTPPSDFESVPADPKKEKVDSLKRQLPYYGTYFTITYDRSSDVTKVFIYTNKELGEKEFLDYLISKGVESSSWIKNLETIYK